MLVLDQWKDMFLSVARTTTSICLICGESKKISQMNKNKNELLHSNFSVCKDCCNSVASVDDKTTMIAVCQLMNIAYVEKIATEIRENNKIFGDYLRKIAPSKKYQFFSDSDFKEETNKPQNNYGEIEITQELIQKWGSGYSQQEYADYESSLEYLMNIKEPSTQFELMRYITNVQLKKVLNDSLKDGDSKAITAMRKAYADDLKELGLDSVLNAKSDTGENLGQRIKFYENNKPIPDREEFDDVAGIKGYVSKWFIIPLKRVFGMATEEEVGSLYDNI